MEKNPAVNHYKHGKYSSLPAVAGDSSGAVAGASGSKYINPQQGVNNDNPNLFDRSTTLATPPRKPLSQRLDDIYTYTYIVLGYLGTELGNNINQNLQRLLCNPDNYILSEQRKHLCYLVEVIGDITQKKSPYTSELRSQFSSLLWMMIEQYESENIGWLRNSEIRKLLERLDNKIISFFSTKKECLEKETRIILKHIENLTDLIIIYQICDDVSSKCEGMSEAQKSFNAKQELRKYALCKIKQNKVAMVARDICNNPNNEELKGEDEQVKFQLIKRLESRGERILYHELSQIQYHETKKITNETLVKLEEEIEAISEIELNCFFNDGFMVLKDYRYNVFCTVETERYFARVRYKTADVDGFLDEKLRRDKTLLLDNW